MRRYEDGVNRQLHDHDDKNWKSGQRYVLPYNPPPGLDETQYNIDTLLSRCRLNVPGFLIPYMLHVILSPISASIQLDLDLQPFVVELHDDNLHEYRPIGIMAPNRSRPVKIKHKVHSGLNILTLSSLTLHCHLHPLQAANCCRNSRLVVDEDDLKCV